MFWWENLGLFYSLFGLSFSLCNQLNKVFHDLLAFVLSVQGNEVWGGCWVF